MNRRTTLIAPIALIGTAALLKSQAARATTISGNTYITEVLQYGTLSKITSEFALARTMNLSVQANFDVHAFADGEVKEQTAIAQALTNSANPPPATLTAAQQADLEKVKTASDADFNQTYLTVQIQGHQALLKIQDEFLGANPIYSENLVHISLIAKAFILNHLIVLNALAAAI